MTLFVLGFLTGVLSLPILCLLALIILNAIAAEKPEWPHIDDSPGDPDAWKGGT